MQTYLFVYLHFKNKLKNNIMTPQIIYLVIIFAGLLLSANMHGKEKRGKHNFWNHLFNTVITISLLYWGGFFDVFFK